MNFIFTILFALTLSLPLAAAAEPADQPRSDTWISLGLDERLSNGQDRVRNGLALEAIQALLIPGTSLPGSLSEADARIILRSAVKSGALDEKGRFGSDLKKALKIKELDKDFFDNERIEALGSIPLVRAAREKFPDFLYAFIIMTRVAQVDLVDDFAFEKLEKKTRDYLLKIGLDVLKANGSEEERRDLLYRIIGHSMNAAMGLDSSRPRALTAAEKTSIENFFTLFEDGAFTIDLLAQANRRSAWKTTARVVVWATIGAVLFTLWRYYNYMNSHGLDPALISSFDDRDNPLWIQGFVTLVPTFFTGFASFFFHRDRNPLRHLVQRARGRLSPLGVQVTELVAGAKDLCMEMLSKFGPKVQQVQQVPEPDAPEDIMEILRRAQGD